ncbi:MAG: PD40 domain-containing protein [Bacteroidetes bacterium]|nr:PD40 domain-containing protein [Bacteroidota bacterium]
MKLSPIFKVFFILILFPYTDLFAQQPVENKFSDFKTAEEKMKWGNYEGALDDFLTILEKEPRNMECNYNIGVCYLNSNINKTKAIPYLEKVLRTNDFDQNARYLMGRAYHFAYRFDDAIKAYTAFKEAGKGKPENLKEVDRQVQECINAKELMKFPLKVTFENLGLTVNSPFADYYPFIPKDESFLVFNSKRSGTGTEVNIDGAYPPTIFISNVKNGQYTKAQVVGPPITLGDGNEEVIGLSGQGDKMLLYYFKDGKGDIYMSITDANKVFTKARILGDNVNSKGHEIAASVTSEGDAIYFASNRPGGIGGVDIYVSRILPNGSWGSAENLGPEINTNQDEDFPNISPDGKTLYFSSKGHTSMGGYDIFKADRDEEARKWIAVKNVGYPINTPEDDMNLRMSENGRYAYISALREKGIGDLDIYRVTFDDVEPQYSVIRGVFDSYDPKKKVNPADVFITVTDNKTQEIYGNYLPNKTNGHYVIILPPGTYRMEVEAAGFQTHAEIVNVLDKSSLDTEVNKDITLKVKLPE